VDRGLKLADSLNGGDEDIRSFMEIGARSRVMVNEVQSSHQIPSETVEPKLRYANSLVEMTKSIIKPQNIDSEKKPQVRAKNKINLDDLFDDDETN
jgi:hypothetical protein